MTHFSLAELNPHSYPVTPTIEANLRDLIGRLSKLREAYGKAMTVTSGLRSQSQQDALIAAGKSTASKSKHLTGQAADIFDGDGALKAWLEEDLGILDTFGLWCEDFNSTPNWVHFQSVPPKSGKRVFLP